MAGFSYEDLEKEFLEAMATRFCFTGKNRLAFVQRFSEQYAELTDKALADEYEREPGADRALGAGGGLLGWLFSVITGRLMMSWAFT